jgi:tellurite resistance protein
VALWAFATLAYLGKVLRRPGVVGEDLRVLPGRSGLAAMTMGGMAAAGLIAAYSGPAALVLVGTAFAGHTVLALLLIRLLLALPPDARTVNPTLHLSFVGFIVAGPVAVALEWRAFADLLFWGMLLVALVIWGLSARQFVRVVPPAPLRPLLAVHLAPAALLATLAAVLNRTELAVLFLVGGSALAVVLVVSGRWVTSAGVTALWGAFTFPLAALATAALMQEGWLWPGLALTAVALLVIPSILWWVLKRWPGGKLAAVTNAAEA